MTGRGLTWTSAEVRCLLDLWAEEHIQNLLQKVHKNNDVYKLIRDKLEEKGFVRTIDQCRVKVKKLRQQYFKVRDSLHRSGSSRDEKDKFVWYDDIDKIIGTKPQANPVDVVESFQPSPQASSDSSSPIPASEDASLCTSNLSGKCLLSDMLNYEKQFIDIFLALFHIMYLIYLHFTTNAVHYHYYHCSCSCLYLNFIAIICCLYVYPPFF